MRAGRAALPCSLALALACGDASEAPQSPPRTEDLGGDVVARVGSQPVHGATVRRIAEAQGVSLAEARERAVSDALMAEEARARRLDSPTVEAATVARILFDQLRLETAGPVTDAELEQVTERRWVSLRRPAATRVIHAVVLVQHREPARRVTDDERVRADRLAAEVRVAVELAADEARREPRAKSDPAAQVFEKLASLRAEPPLKIRVETLDPITDDGRFASRRGGSVVPEFTAALAALKERGDLTGPFRTSFGTHVAMMLERLPPLEVPAEERRRLVREEVLDDRIRARRKAMVDGSATEVAIAPNAEALLDLVRVQP
jgi:hypothetical protein